MPTWPVAEYTLAGVALVAIAFVAATLVKERRAPKTKEGAKASPEMTHEMTQVVTNNTQALSEVGKAVTDLREFLVATNARQETKLDEVLAYVRRGGGK